MAVSYEGSRSSIARKADGAGLSITSLVIRGLWKPMRQNTHVCSRCGKWKYAANASWVAVIKIAPVTGSDDATSKRQADSDVQIRLSRRH
jgi:hypothetical protein